MDDKKGVDIVEKSFNQLPAEGKQYLKEFLEGLVSLQKSVLESVPLTGEPQSQNGKEENN
jgi:hypothetical protein